MMHVRHYLVNEQNHCLELLFLLINLIEIFVSLQQYLFTHVSEQLKRIKSQVKKNKYND